jgi:hypothetical protein
MPNRRSARPAAFHQLLYQNQPMTEFIAKGAMMRVADLNLQFSPFRLQQLGENRKFLAVQIERLMRCRVHEKLAAGSIA